MFTRITATIILTIFCLTQTTFAVPMQNLRKKQLEPPADAVGIGQNPFVREVTTALMTGVKPAIDAVQVPATGTTNPSEFEKVAAHIFASDGGGVIVLRSGGVLHFDKIIILGHPHTTRRGVYDPGTLTIHCPTGKPGDFYRNPTHYVPYPEIEFIGDEEAGKEYLRKKSAASQPAAAAGDIRSAGATGKISVEAIARRISEINGDDPYEEVISGLRRTILAGKILRNETIARAIVRTFGVLLEGTEQSYRDAIRIINGSARISRNAVTLRVWAEEFGKLLADSDTSDAAHGFANFAENNAIQIANSLQGGRDWIGPTQNLIAAIKAAGQPAAAAGEATEVFSFGKLIRELTKHYYKGSRGRHNDFRSVIHSVDIVDGERNIVVDLTNLPKASTRIQDFLPEKFIEFLDQAAKTFTYNLSVKDKTIYVTVIRSAVAVRSSGEVVAEINTMATELVGKLPAEKAVAIEQGSGVVITNGFAFTGKFLVFLPALASDMLKDVSRFAVIVPEEERPFAPAQKKMIEYFNAFMPEGKKIEIFSSEEDAFNSMKGLNVELYGYHGEQLYISGFEIKEILVELLGAIKGTDYGKFEEISKKFKALQEAVAAEV